MAHATAVKLDQVIRAAVRGRQSVLKLVWVADIIWPDFFEKYGDSS